ncbi:MAG TPA: bifunctional pyr operon transcriptional regulator/uracil phosphoribosyltransferase PyrR [bacterium]|nr:bifunctional pyr operon transcriptional regulator/uracil phosphoribosyltransferase PyrR [bacterium]
MREKATVMDADGIRRAVMRMAHEILERNKTAAALAIVGVETRGVPLAHRLAAAISQIEGVPVPVASLDTRPFRDDRPAGPPVGPPPRLPFPMEDRIIVLVDDVLYTGRTVRAALDGLIAQGRPHTIQLAVLVDRGHRELPIRPDFVGKNLPTSSREHVAVRLAEIDGVDGVVIEEPA